MSDENIEMQCHQMYLDNITYFEEKHPDILKMISTFESAIELNMYQEKYSLEFIDNSFNIKVLDDGTFIYDTNATKFAKTMVRDITLDDKNSFKTFMPIQVPDEYIINKDITKTHLQTLYPFIKYCKTNSTNDFKMQKIDKFVFFGCLLGTHIEQFVDKFNPRVILISEHNLELFKYSLFVTNYAKIAQKTNIIFSITANLNQFSDTISVFMEDFNMFNYIIKFYLANSEYTIFMETFLNFLSIAKASNFPFSANLMTVKRHMKLKQKNYNFIDFTNKSTLFKNNNVILIAPGPSLSKNLQWLKENRQYFLIIALGASLKTLYKNEIIPDIVTSVDPTEDILDQFDGIDENYFDDIILFTASNSPKKIFKIFKKEKTYIYQVIYDLLGLLAFGGKSIGDLTISMILKLGAKNIFLLGTDLSVDSKTGSAHVKEHQHYKEIDNIEKYNIETNSYITDQDLIEVDGNLKDKVLTTRHFKRILDLYKNHIDTLSTEDTEVYNLSDGALIEGTISKEIKDLDLSKFIENKKISLKKLKLDKNKLSILGIDEKIMLVQNVLDVYQKYRDKTYNSYIDMMYDKHTISIDVITILKQEPYSKVGIDLIYSFNNNVEGYVNTFFNQSINRKKQKKFNTFFKLWIEPQINIFTQYKNILENK